MLSVGQLGKQGAAIISRSWFCFILFRCVCVCKMKIALFYNSEYI